jgi:hypothetical protein
MAYQAYANYNVFFSTQAKAQFAIDIAGGATHLKIKPSDAASMFGLTYPPPAGPRPLDGFIISPPYILGMNIPHPGPSGVILTGDGDDFFVPKQTPSPGMQPGDDMILSWSMSIIVLGPEYGTADPTLIASIPQRRWTMGFETSLLYEFRGSGSANQCRDSSRVVDGLGHKVRSDGAAQFSAVLANSTATGLPSRQSWERFYFRIRRFGNTTFTLWRSGGTVSGNSGGVIKLTSVGLIELYNRDTFANDTLIGTAGNFDIDTWYKVDIIVEYATAFFNGRLNVWVNGVSRANAIVGTGGAGLGSIQNHGSSVLIDIITPHTWEFDVDDWHNAEIPNVGGVETLNSIDWLTGTHSKLVRVLGGSTTNWTGTSISMNQIRNAIGSGLSLNATIALSTITLISDALDYLNIEDQNISDFVYGPACAAIVTNSSQAAGGVNTSRLGYILNGLTTVMAFINPGGAAAQSLLTYLPIGSMVPYSIAPFSVVYEKKNSADAAVVNALTAIVQYIGEWGLEDVPADSPQPPEFMEGMLHNCLYHNTSWAYIGAVPDAPICVSAGTYIGNGTFQTISSLTHLLSPQPFHFLIIRNLAGGAPVILNTTAIASQQGSGTTAQSGDIPLIGYDILNATSYFIVNGTGARVNQNLATYQFFAIHDPSARFILNGEYSHGNSATLVTNPLLDGLFQPEYAIILVGPATGGVYYKGPSFTGLEVADANGSIINNVMQFGMGQFSSSNGINSSTNAISYSMFRTLDGSDLTMIQVVSYVGDGTASRVISLTPITNRFPLVAFVTKRTGAAQSTWYRDPSHAGINSTQLAVGGLTVTGIIGGGIDTITVGSAANVLGALYDIMTIVGTASGWLNGVYCGPNGIAPGDFWDPDPEPLPPGVGVLGEGGLSIGGDSSLTLLQDVSGIYTLVPGKHSDTLYDDQTGQSSIDMKIPDPTFKTGYVGG